MEILQSGNAGERVVSGREDDLSLFVPLPPPPSCSGRRGRMHVISRRVHGLVFRVVDL